MTRALSLSLSVSLLVLQVSRPALAAEKPPRAKAGPHASSSSAAEPWLASPLASDPKAALASAAALAGNGDGAIRVLLEEERHSFDAEGRKTSTSRRVFLVNSVDGLEEYGTVNSSWKPWRDEPPSLRARVIHEDGTVRTLDPATIGDLPASSDPDIFDDRRIRSAPLPGLSVGALVEWETTEREKAPFPGGTLGAFTMGYSVPVHRFRLSIETPPELPFAFKTYGMGDAMPAVSRGERGLVRTWESVAKPPIQLEYGAPADVVQLPFIEFSTGTSWADIATYYTNVVEEKLAASELPDEAAVAEAVKPASTRPGGARATPKPAVKANASKAPSSPVPPSRPLRDAAVAEALAFVHREVRYTGIAFGEGAIIPEVPAKVCSRKYGDCKDQATLLVGLLRRRGIPSHVALLRAGQNRDTSAALPALAAFNHAIVYVEDQDLWIDPTSPFHRAGDLPHADRGRLALICRKGTRQLVRTPALAADENIEHAAIEVWLAPEGPARLTETTEVTGVFEASFRGGYDGGEAAARRKGLEEFVSNAYGKAILERCDMTDSRDLSRAFQLRLDVGKTGVGLTGDAEAAFAFRLGNVLANFPNPRRDPEEGDGKPAPPKRRLDFAATPFHHEVTYRVVPPPGFVSRELPPAETLSLGPGTFSTRYELAPDGAVLARLKVALPHDRLTPAELEDVKRTRAEIEKRPAVSLAFDHAAEAAAEAGKIREALEVLRKLAKDQPGKADPHRRMAKLLLGLGLGEAGRREAEIATRLEPDSAPAWHRLGMARQHDLFGRIRRKGWDVAGADAALAKAASLAPDNLEYRVDEAIALEFDAEGRRYKDTQRLSRAVERYQALFPKHAKNEFVLMNTAVALLQLGKTQELLALVKDKDKTNPKLANPTLTAWAIQEGVERAKQEARRLLPDSAQRRAAMEGAAATLFSLRRYAEAAAFFTEAARGSPQAAVLTERAELCKRLRRETPEDALAKPGDPASLVRAFLLKLFADAEPKLAGMKPFFAKSAVLSDGAAEGAFAAQRSEVLRKVRASGGNMDMARDTLASALELSVEGTAQEGIKVTVDNTSVKAGQKAEEAYWLVEEGGSLRILGLASDRISLCREAQAKVREGDLEAAKRWLDRALKELAVSFKDDRPIFSPLLPRFWPGKPDQDPKAAILLAAAAGAIGAPEPKLDDTALAVLKAAAKERPNDRDRAAALISAHLAREEWKDALEWLAPMREKEPEVEDWMLATLFSLHSQKKDAEAEALALSHLARKPQHARVKRILCDLYLERGAVLEAATTSEELAQAPDPDPEDFNQAAWFALVADKADEKAVSRAQKGVNATGRQSHAVLNTLAAVYAEIGKADEARALVNEGLELTQADEPSPADWWVVGRVLEGYGLTEDAVAAYRRADDKSRKAGSIGYLAQKRLAAIGPVVVSGRFEAGEVEPKAKRKGK